MKTVAQKPQDKFSYMTARTKARGDKRKISSTMKVIDEEREDWRKEVEKMKFAVLILSVFFNLPK